MRLQYQSWKLNCWILNAMQSNFLCQRHIVFAVYGVLRNGFKYVQKVLDIYHDCFRYLSRSFQISVVCVSDICHSRFRYLSFTFQISVIHVLDICFEWLCKLTLFLFKTQLGCQSINIFCFIIVQIVCCCNAGVAGYVRL